MKKARYLLISLLFFSCSANDYNRDFYEQRYDNINELNKMSLRNKGWFINIISNDAYDLKNDSYLDSLLAFGTHSYLNDKYYDSVFNAPSSKKIDISLFKNQLIKHSNRAPDWFLKPSELDDNELMAINIDRAYIVRLCKSKKIYYIITN